MIRTVPTWFSLLVAASAFTLSAGNLEYKVRVRNLTYKQPFSAILVFAHTEDIGGINVGGEAFPEIKTMAEQGDLSDLLAPGEAGVDSPGICGLAYGSDELSPGGEELLTLVVDEEKCPNGALLTMVGKLANTNDGFVGIDFAVLETSASSTFYAPAYDAGTEENNELCSHIPGPACSRRSGNEEAGPGEGFVHVHRGFYGIGGDLSADEYGWTNPVAEVFIDKPTSV